MDRNLQVSESDPQVTGVLTAWRYRLAISPMEIRYLLCLGLPASGQLWEDLLLYCIVCVVVVILTYSSGMQVGRPTSACIQTII